MNPQDIFEYGLILSRNAVIKKALHGWQDYQCRNYVIEELRRRFPITTAHAKLSKLKTQDGFFTVNRERAQLGKRYVVIRESRGQQNFTNTPTQKKFSADVILAWDELKFDFLPTEILEIKE